MKVGLVSLGCPKNLVDSENMLGRIRESTFEITPDSALADIIVVNTCGFIEPAKEESIQTVLEMAEYKKNNCQLLILAGCLGERYAEELLRELPEVDVITGSHAWADIVMVLERALTGERFIFKPREAVIYDRGPRLLTTPGHTAYLKIAEGCDNACSYCVIPQLRGPYKSRSLPSILAEAEELAAGGVKELILIAQDVTKYGYDQTNRFLLPELLQELCAIPAIEWIRILYTYPQHITTELLSVIASQPKICKYLDIPLQHVSAAVLRRMNRPGNKESITALLHSIREKIPGICLRTTFIVGLPGETEAEYQELKNFIIQERFDRVGIFSYSCEEGTPAAQMPQIGEKIKEARYHELMAVQAAISEEINIALEESKLDVLVDSIKEIDGKILGIARSYREAPDIDGVIYLENTSKIALGDIVKVKIEQGFTYDLAATII